MNVPIELRLNSYIIKIYINLFKHMKILRQTKHQTYLLLSIIYEFRHSKLLKNDPFISKIALFSRPKNYEFNFLPPAMVMKGIVFKDVIS